MLYDFLSYSRSNYPNYTFLPGVVQESFSSGLEDVNKIYTLNPENSTVSIASSCTNPILEALPGITAASLASLPCAFPKHSSIVVAQGPGPIAINEASHIVYIGYPESGTISVIKGFTDKVAVGTIFNVNPPGSGAIKCDGTIYPTNTYIYVDSGANCTAQNNKGFEFNTWTQSPLTNRNSSTPIEESSDHPETIAVDRYGIFTANFGVPHQLSTQDLFTYLTGAISAAVAINGVIVLVPGWRRAKKQRAHLRECIHMIDGDVGKSHKNAIEDKIIGYYVDGKLSEDHRQLLKDKISEYYDSVKGSESGA